ncbi:hypothetical protein ZHAS_00007231 [Anopheles sinensis]|uniref:Malate dehydrogenase n=1 Tax=Anopheles sinensis TaxID=74873 RepID=A0A084VPG4_ANOSI|nr:hypothetical protein ZHAS_00007231 [Anopheles sinensis]
MVAKGDVFGPNQPLVLHLLDIPPMMGVLEGVVMELADCALPLLVSVVPTADPAVAFKDVDAAFLVGAMPRKQGMERKDLLSANVKIFKVQGEALDKYAKKDVKVLVVGNPANTNALVCSHYAPSIPKENFTAMTRLDQNRAQAQIAARLGVGITKVKNVIIWGNHSATQVPDARNASVEMSSAMSAAKAASDHMRDWFAGTREGEYVSMGVISDGSYGAPKDIVFSFPVQIQNRQWKIVQGLSVDEFTRSKLDVTAKELLEEKEEAMAVCAAD